ncbi:MAG TPA: hypothetical protein VFF06_08160 [Polyangia bacterium]|nr:hypothetical protein [Polyangia bacterium]
MAHRATPAALALVVCLAPACGSSLIPLGTAVPVTPTLPASIPLEVTTREVGVSDPLPLPRSTVRFGGMEEPLGHAIATAVVPWAEAHRGEREGGWQLQLQLIQARVDRRGERLAVTLGVRATLVGRVGNVYLAQKQAHCHQSALVEPAEAPPLFYHCMMDLGRELAGWLGGVQP